MKLSKFFVVLAVLFGLSMPSFGAEYVVKLRDTSLTAFSFLSAKQMFQREYAPKGLLTDEKLAVVQADSIQELKVNPAVEYVEPNIRLHILTAPNPLAWGVEKIKAPALWDRGIVGDKKIKVAVIDTGIDYNHSELKDYVWVGPEGEHGFNFITNKPDPMDDQGHGTHVSGTIGGKTVGVAPGVTLIGVKFLDAEGGGSLAGAIDSINYASNLGADIMSNSWGGGGESTLLEEAVLKAIEKGTVFVAAAGNESANNDVTSSLPSNYKGVLSVAATDKSDTLAYFSNYGQKVRVAAPGVGVYSSTPGEKYASYSGTSMACPHVSGAVALMLSAGVTKEDAISKLEGTGVPINAGPKKKIKHGRIDLEAAMNSTK